jgi:transcription elongation factor Elf1
MLSELNKRISGGEENIDTTTRQENLQKEISAAQQLIIDYEHYNNVLQTNTDILSENTISVDENVSSSEDFTSKAETMSSAMDAVAKATQEQSKEGKISYSTALDLISANASLAQYLTQTANGYIFDSDAARLATQNELINAFAKYGIRDAAIAAANGNYVFAQSAIASANATEAEKTALYGLLKTFAAMNVKVSLPSGGGSGISAQEKLNTLKKEAYQQEIKAVNAQKKAAQDQIKALQDKKDAYNDIIDAQKESLRLTKDEVDYQRELENKNKELADIDAELIQLQFDNSEEGNARRLELEEQRAEKTADIAEYQADRTYDIEIEALDREADAYARMIDMQIAGVQTMIDGYDSVIAKINEMIDALSKLASASSGSGGSSAPKATSNTTAQGNKKYTGTSPSVVNAEIALGRDLNNNGILGLSSGGSFETSSEGLIRVHPNEVGAVLNKSQISAAAPFASFLSSIMKNSGTPNISSNNGGGGGVSIGDIQISVAGNLDKTVLPDLKEMIMKTITDATRNTGTLRNAKSFSV